VGDIDDPDAGQRVGERVAGETETGVYDALELPLIPPELREDRGEIERAAAGDLPDLIETGDLRGDLHVHTTASDGTASIAEMAAAAAEFGHEYVAIADHASGPGMVGGVGLDDDELAAHAEAIRAADEDASIELLAAVEANVGADGSVSVGEDALSALDCVVASPHSALDGDGTDRLVAAIEHPEVDILGHPTGRLLNQRPGHDIDAERVAEAAAANGTALEINADPRRLDLDSSHVKLALEAGATIAINTDAHSIGAFGNARFGVHAARRGWVESADVLNCRDIDGVRAFLE
jgi:DNA polymerase (family 10)